MKWKLLICQESLTCLEKRLLSDINLMSPTTQKQNIFKDSE